MLIFASELAYKSDTTRGTKGRVLIKERNASNLPYTPLHGGADSFRNVLLCKITVNKVTQLAAISIMVTPL